MTNISIADMGRGYFGKNICLISCLSFEERSLVAARGLFRNGMHIWLCIQNSDIEINIDKLKFDAVQMAEHGRAELSFYEVSKKKPLSLADAMYNSLSRALDTDLDIVADITTMTHEMVLVFVAALSEFDFSARKVNIIYNTAGQYSAKEIDQARRWISRGIHGIRSVIGYSGLWAPGEPTTLVALPGFDLERVQRIAEELEPDRILVGIGRPGLAAHGWLYERNRAVANQLILGEDGNIFEFDALEPVSAISAVVQKLSEISGNVVVAPFNSKISTLAIGVLAQRHPEWQVCYAPALIYNTDYSTPSENFVELELGDIRAQAALIDNLPSLSLI